MQSVNSSPFVQTGKRLRESPELENVKRSRVIKARKTAHALTLKKIFIEQIRSGLKTVEARPYCRGVTKYEVGDTVRFYYYRNAKDDVICKITRIKKFATFKELLEESHFSLCIPGTKNLDEALKLYEKIPKYSEKERTFGVVAIHLAPLSGESQNTNS